MLAPLPSVLLSAPCLSVCSFHPKHTFDAIILSQMIRYMRICSDLKYFHEACSLLFKALSKERHYSKRKLRELKRRFLVNYRRQATYDGPVGASLKCKKRRCECCLWIQEVSYFEFHEDDLIYEHRIFGQINCQSSNLIYVIECSKCHERYVGETEQTLAKRLHGHLSDIRTYQDKPVADHFNNSCWPETDHLTIFAIESIPDQGSKSKNESKRLLRESYWISCLNTAEPHGMNRKFVKKRNITVCLPFNRTSQAAFKLIRDSYQHIQEQFPTIFHGNLTCAYKRNQNVSDFLVRAKLK